MPANNHRPILLIALLIIIIASFMLLVYTIIQNKPVIHSTASQSFDRIPPQPEPLIKIDESTSTVLSLTEDEKAFIKSKTRNDLLIKGLINKAGGVKKIGVGIVVTDDSK